MSKINLLPASSGENEKKITWNNQELTLTKFKVKDLKKFANFDKTDVTIITQLLVSGVKEMEQSDFEGFEDMPAEVMAGLTDLSEQLMAFNNLAPKGSADPK